jgi:hypothetical protein
MHKRRRAKSASGASDIAAVSESPSSANTDFSSSAYTAIRVAGVSVTMEAIQRRRRPFKVNEKEEDDCLAGFDLCPLSDNRVLVIPAPHKHICEPCEYF